MFLRCLYIDPQEERGGGGGGVGDGLPYISIIHRKSPIQAQNDLHGYCWPSLVCEVSQLTYKVHKGVFESVVRELKKFNEHVIFRDR